MTFIISNCTSNSSWWLMIHEQLMVQNLKPGLHIVVSVGEHACDYASKRILKLPKYRLKIFLFEISKPIPLQRFRVQTISVQLNIHVRDHVLAILTTYMETRLKQGQIKSNCFLSSISKPYSGEADTPL